jgi:hypothetical protein
MNTTDMARKKVILGPGTSNVTGIGPGIHPSRNPDVYILSIAARTMGLHLEAVFSSLKGAKKHAMATWEANPVLIAHGIWKCEADMVDEVWIHRMKVHGE